MSGFRIEKGGFTKISALISSIVDDMLANGFTKVWPAQYTPGTSKDIILKAGPNVDPLSETQPWCVKFLWSKDAADKANVETTNGGKLDVIFGAPNMFTSEGQHANYFRMAAGASDNKDVVGLVGTAVNRDANTDIGSPDRTFIDRTRLKVTSGASGRDDTLAYPMSYQLTITPRGFALVVWEQGQERDGNRYSFVIAQRPVDNVTGAVVVTGKCPVHCVYGLMKSSVNQPWTDVSNFNFRRFTIREADVLVPAPMATFGTINDSAANPMMGVDATKHSQDYNAIINGSQQVSISEDNKYVVSFPTGLNTARYAYKHELDMMAYCSADVVSQGTEIPLQVYGESAPRKYLAMNANGGNNSGMRLLLLVEGGGIDKAGA